MTGRQVHYEIYVRKRPASGWTLELATESREGATTAAKELVDTGKVVAARVSKETLDDETREFQTVTILNLGQAEPTKTLKVREDVEPLCVTPQDLYTIHARERIGRLLEDWLGRNHATPFELLHRPDLVEQLEASGVEMQHAIQKIAIPEAQARGVSVHELIRLFQALVQRAVERLLKDGRKGVLPDIDKEGFSAAATRLAKEPERVYLLAAGVAASLAPARNWDAKISRLLDLADAAPPSGPGRALALTTLEQPLGEILGTKPGLDDLLGRDLDLGRSLCGMTRLVAFQAVDALMSMEKSVAKVMPALSDEAQRLAWWLTKEEFADVRGAVGRRILRELNGPRRLCPKSAADEIDVLRGLGMSLTAAAGKQLPLEDVQAAFSARSQMLVRSDFVESYLAKCETAREEIQALVWLTENVIGPGAKREAGRWLMTVVTSLRFEKDFRAGADSAATRLALLASLQRAVARSGLVDEDYRPLQLKLGEIGGLAEADAKLCAQVARANAPPLQRLTLLLKLACGDAAPLGPAADRAKAEVMKLIRLDETRQAIARSPEDANAMRGLLQAVGIAA